MESNRTKQKTGTFDLAPLQADIVIKHELRTNMADLARNGFTIKYLSLLPSWYKID